MRDKVLCNYIYTTVKDEVVRDLTSANCDYELSSKGCSDDAIGVYVRKEDVVLASEIILNILSKYR